MRGVTTVRILTEAAWRKACEDFPPDRNNSGYELMRLAFGKTVRILLPPRAPSPFSVCQDPVWEVHPEDCRRIGWDVGSTLCRHGFEAD